MPQLSAGVLLYRRAVAGVDVLLVHPGGPLWRNRQIGWWQIPKGLVEPGETPEAAARREAEEELGLRLIGALRPLGRIRQAGGKRVQAFALEQDFDASQIVSNSFRMEWPPRSGRQQFFSEIDEARWYPLAEASAMMLASQRPLLDALATLLGFDGADTGGEIDLNAPD
ncbi:NUDIX domain-containing protein [soil metagenome]